jgi:cell division protein FtsI/penicillin-binding protein 2
MKHRNYLLSLGIYLFFAIILGRLFYWQIIKNQELKEKSLSQTYKLTKTSPKRGLILASDDYPLTLNENSYILSIYKPNLKTDLKSVLAQIESIKPKFLQLNQGPIDFFQNKSEQKWIQFNTLFSIPEKAKLEKISGLEFTPQASRYYPEDTLAKNILGIIAKNDQGNYKGYGGLEGYYDKTLSGRTGFAWTIKNALNQTILTRQGWKISEIDGQDIKTSINRSLQNILEKKIEQGVNNYQADMAMATIMD